MGMLTFLGRWFGGSAAAAAGVPNPFDDYWYTPRGLATAAGADVTPETALNVSAVFAATAVIAEDVASQPLITYRRRADGGKDRAFEHPLYELLHDRPNAEQTPFEFYEMMIGHALLRGRGVARIRPGRRGFADQLIPLHPDRLTREVVASGAVRYRYRPLAGPEEIIAPDELFSIGGRLGMGIVARARESIGEALAAQQYGAGFFGRGARPGGILKTAGSLSPEAAQRLRASWTALHGGPENAGRVAVLEEGLEWQAVGLTNEDAQFLESRTFSVQEISRWFRIAPHFLGDLSHATFSNIEHQSIDHATRTIRPWNVRAEQAVGRDLILPGERREIFAEFLMDSLLRGDAKSRNEALWIERQAGVVSQNEWRAMLNRNPIGPAGDTYWNAQPGVAAPPGGGGAGGNGSARAVQIARAAAHRVVRREIAAMDRFSRREPDPEAVAAFWAGHVGWAAEALALGVDTAIEWVNRREAEHAALGAEFAQTEAAAAVALADLVLGGSDA